MRFHLRTHVLLALALGIAACAGISPQPAPPETPAIDAEVENLAAFARLYGYVRWFHPGDEAAEMDWERFAVYGAGRVRAVQDRGQLQAVLEELFLPVAPGLHLYAEGSPAPSTERLLPADTAGMQPVAWQHFGAGLGQVDRLHKSLRLNRAAPRAAGGDSSLFNQGIDATPYRGQRVRLRAAVRAEVSGAGNEGRLWLSVASGPGRSSFLDKMEQRPITAPGWAVYEAVGPVADDATMIAFGAFLRGQGRLWVDAFELHVAAAGTERWTPVPIVNPGFEDGPGTAPGWNLLSRSYRYAADAEQAHAGRRALRIDAPAPLTGPLFAEHAQPGEVVDKPLGAGLAVQLPLALYSDGQGTWPRAVEPALAALKGALAEFKSTGPYRLEDTSVRLAGVVIAWNLFQHFYPYFDAVAVDWAAELPRALRSALEDADADAFMVTMQKLVAASGDGHGRVSRGSTPFHPPFAAEWIEERVVIVRSLAPETFQPGDVVLSVDGVDAVAQVRAAQALIAGSPQWRRHRALAEFGAGSEGGVLQLVLLRGDQRVEVQTRRSHRGPVPGVERPHLAELRPGTWYVNLGAAPMDEIRPRLDALAAAEAVIFDLRGYPKENSEILRHLLREPEQAEWMLMPRITRPDQELVAGYERYGWKLQPAQPHIGGRIAFLADGRAISYAESVMAYVEGQKLGEIVGAPTAGTNGAIRSFGLPGGVGIVFTGMRVLRHDGSLLHGAGIAPTIPVQPTLAGLRASRDEVLEAALERLQAPAAP